MDETPIEFSDGVQVTINNQNIDFSFLWIPKDKAKKEKLFATNNIRSNITGDCHVGVMTKGTFGGINWTWEEEFIAITNLGIMRFKPGQYDRLKGPIIAWH
jgi:hypothetical protein